MEEVERRYVLIALVTVIGVVAVLAGVDLVRDAMAERPTRIELMRRCLEQERGYAVYELPLTSLLAGVGQGGLRTIAEDFNEAEVLIADSEEQAARLAREAQRNPRFEFVERRFDILYAWRHPPSPTQRQNVIECSY
jgi:hypothetical protein